MYGGRGSSRRESPASRASRPPQSHWGGSSSRVSRSHSYSGDDLQADDVTRSLGGLSLDRQRREESRSRAATGTRMPYIPFQRVQQRRRKPTLPPTNPEFRLHNFREPRDRRYRRFRDAPSMDTFDTEYNARYKSRQSMMGRGKRKPARQKNASQLTSVLRDRPVTQQQGDHPPSASGEDMESVRTSDRDERSEADTNDETAAAQAGDERNPSTESWRSQRASRFSGGSNDQETASGHEERAPSSASVKFPRIQASPPMGPDSARSVQGTGAAPPKMPNLPPSEDPTSSLSQRPMSLTRLQPLDSSRWVEGKGAGRLHLFFQIHRPPAESDNTTSPATKSPQRVQRADIANWVQGKGTSRPHQDLQLLTLNPTERDHPHWPPTSPTPRPSPSGNTDHHYDTRNTSANHTREEGRNLSRSMSGSELCPPHTSVNNLNSKTKNTLKAKQKTLCKKTATEKTKEEGGRPKTAQPRLTLTQAQAGDVSTSDTTTQKKRATIIHGSHTDVNLQFKMSRSCALPPPSRTTTVSSRRSSYHTTGSQSLHPHEDSSHADPPPNPEVNSDPEMVTHESDESDNRPKSAGQPYDRWPWVPLKRWESDPSKLGRNPLAITGRGNSLPVGGTHGGHCGRDTEASSQGRSQEVAAVTKEDTMWTDQTNQQNPSHRRVSHLERPPPQLGCVHHSGSSTVRPEHSSTLPLAGDEGQPSVHQPQESYIGPSPALQHTTQHQPELHHDSTDTHHTQVTATQCPGHLHQPPSLTAC
ncbi:uncharacterized protein [Panulirus ornatus]|uniref:uncharacterized protein isoform X2 n=1 Tax=Panulirus ornatus TaxID=150431 RepID=UPI003A847720